MNSRKLFSTSTVAVIGVVALSVSFAIAGSAQDGKDAHADHNLPPGMSAEDMQACMVAGTPGEKHAELAKRVGHWEGEGHMWMGPEAQALPYQCTTDVSVVMDGRYVKCEFNGELPGMGQFHGVGYHGYDNVTQEFVTTWLDNHSTGIMSGTGERSSDGKTMTWTYGYTCPITKKPTAFRQVEKITGENAMTMEMFTKDPNSGKEYKMMSLNFTRKPGSEVAAKTAR